jgi:phenylacetic acid degradation operon negative regulatory protein
VTALATAGPTLPTVSTVSTVLEDLDARPGSSTSLLRTVIGLALRDLGGWIATPHLLTLLAAVEVPAPVARTTVSRLKAKGLLAAQESTGATGYRVTAGAEAMLRRGDRRIFATARSAAGDPWCLVAFSIPESERDRRHQLRRRLTGIGCGTVAPGLWIAPDRLRPEVRAVVDELGLAERTTLFTGTPELAEPLTGAVARWWNLPAAAAAATEFLDAHAADDPAAGAGVPDGAAAFAVMVRAVDRWRVLPYLDPGLPIEALPADWPGTAAAALFDRIRAAYAGPAQAWVRTVVAAGP